MHGYRTNGYRAGETGPAAGGQAVVFLCELGKDYPGPTDAGSDTRVQRTFCSPTLPPRARPTPERRKR